MNELTREEKMRNAEKFFSDIERDRLKIDESKKMIYDAIDFAVREKKIEIIDKLSFYIEKQEGQYAYHYVGGINRIYNMCQIILVEAKMKSRLFWDCCDSYKQMKEKYFITLYALRRIWFELGDISVEEASIYLQSIQISSYALIAILQFEELQMTAVLKHKLMEFFADSWTMEERYAFEHVGL